MGRFVEVGADVLVGRYPQWDVNVGVVLGERGAVVVDTRASPAQGREVLAELRALLGGRPVVAVVVTHLHFDHSFGAGAFDPIALHAHESVPRALPAHAAMIQAWAAEALTAGTLTLAGQPLEADELETIRTLAPQLPDVTFASTARIDLGDRVVELVHHGRGHTDGDIAVRVPGAGVCFLGDLIEESAPPAFGPDSWPLEWSGTLDRHLDDDASTRTFVPGHGAPVDAGFVAEQQALIERLAATIRAAHAEGADPAAAAADVVDGFPQGPAQLVAAFERGFSALEAGGSPTR